MIQVETEITWTPQNLTKEVEDIIVEEMHDEGVRGRAEIRKSFSKSSPSIPGQPPAVVTGRLYRGVRFKVIRGRLELLLGVDSSVPYALPLEFGFGKVQARPYLRPQRMRSVERLTKRLNKRLN